VLDPVLALPGGATPQRTVPLLSVRVLGGFGVERTDLGRSCVSGWQRRTAKTLTKLLATSPGHALHRDQILEILWPDVDVESALNSFGKALHAARRALEPELLPRASSSFLRLSDAIVALDRDRVVVDADEFERLAGRAMQEQSVDAHEAALAAYGGELLPEDRYEDWSEERRGTLATMHARVLRGLAHLLEQRGSFVQAADRLRAVLEQDPSSEDVHRHLMRLYAGMGMRNRAVRQFEVCRELLHRDFGLAPEHETIVLYQDVLSDRIERHALPPAPAVPRGGESPRPPASGQPPATPFVGRQPVLAYLDERLRRAQEGRGGLILVSGEAGVGKTRLVAEFVADARGHGATVLWGGTGGHANHLAYGPFAAALEGWAASRSEDERAELARRYPALVHFVPSLGTGEQLPPLADRPGDEQLYLLPTIVRLLGDLARDRPLVVVLGELRDPHPSTVDLLQYLANLAVQRRWVIVGTAHEQGLMPGTPLRAMIEATVREHVCTHVELHPLSRHACGQLVQALLPDGAVDDALLEQVYTRSLGNPLFVEELIEELRQRDELVLADGRWRDASGGSAWVPRRVRTMVALRVAPMEESVRRVLALAAAAGEIEISLTDLRTGAAALHPPVSDDALLHALDRALDERILEERRGAYAFRHPLVRAALYQDLAKHRRDQLDAALAPRHA
jgi:DNA-binding SARP family transcriptional activator